jgi:hypothetical protein
LFVFLRLLLPFVLFFSVGVRALGSWGVRVLALEELGVAAFFVVFSLLSSFSFVLFLMSALWR